MTKICFTEKALQWLQKQQPSPQAVLVIQLKKSGCAGFEHEMSWEPPPNVAAAQTNALFLVVTPPEDQKALDGLMVDLTKRGLNHEVVWNNPNANESCGCGVSWSFPERALPVIG